MVVWFIFPVLVCFTKKNPATLFGFILWISLGRNDFVSTFKVYKEFF
jgi:hypothetical protein